MKFMCLAFASALLRTCCGGCDFFRKKLNEKQYKNGDISLTWYQSTEISPFLYCFSFSFFLKKSHPPQQVRSKAEAKARHINFISKYNLFPEIAGARFQSRYFAPLRYYTEISFINLLFLSAIVAD